MRKTIAMLIGAAIMTVSVVFVLIVLPTRIKEPAPEIIEPLLEMNAIPASGD